MKTVYLARAESRNFSFQAVGSTEQSANLSLLRGLKLHGEQYNLEAGWWEQNAEIYVQPLILGEVYRDNSQMKEQS